MDDKLKYTIIGWEPFQIEPRDIFDTLNDAVEEKQRLLKENPLNQYRIIPIELEEDDEDI